jgi:hypothetical protein
MNARIEALFHELADLSAGARASYFAKHAIDDETRRELEALPVFDLGSSTFLLRNVGDAAGRALRQLDSNGLRCGSYRLLEVIGAAGWVRFTWPGEWMEKGPLKVQ